MSYGQWGPPPPPSSSNATIALVLGICGIVVCPLVCSICAIVFAKKAYAEIDATGGRMAGRGNAQAGLVLGWIGVGLGALGLLIGIAYLVLFAILVSSDASLVVITPMRGF